MLQILLSPWRRLALPWRTLAFPRRTLALPWQSSLLWRRMDSNGELETYVACISFFTMVNPLLHSGKLLCHDKGWPSPWQTRSFYLAFIKFTAAKLSFRRDEALSLRRRSSLFTLVNYFTATNIFLRRGEPETSGNKWFFFT